MDCWQIIYQNVMDAGKVDSVLVCVVEDTAGDFDTYNLFPLIHRGDDMDYAASVLHDLSLNSFIIGVERQGGYDYEEENMLVLYVMNAESEDHQTNITIEVIEAVLESVDMEV